MGEITLDSHGDYIIFIDESGDHGLLGIDEKYPIFALVFVLIKKSDYIEKIVPLFQQFKFKYFGHDQVILHEHDIRKEAGIFGILRRSYDLRQKFLDDLTKIIETVSFRFFSSIVDKNNLLKKYTSPYNPYEIAMLFCMEKTLEFLLENQQKDKKICLVIESRGKKENLDLELEFRRICDNQAKMGSIKNFKQINFELVFTDKKSNSTGLQIADLIARPLGLSVLRPNQNNRSYEIIKNKGEVKNFPN